MAINKWMHAALKALSYPDIEVKRTYKLSRAAGHTLSAPFRPFYKTWDQAVKVGDRAIPLRVFAAPEGGRSPLLLFFHGGGWVTGTIDSYTRVCANLAKHTGCRVVSVDYRLAPEHKFPAAPEDCYAAARALFLNAALFDIRTEDIVLMGDSAGGNLAAAVSLMARDRGEFLPRRQILLYPATHYDHSDSSPFPSVHLNGTDYLLTAKRVREYLELYAASPADFHNPYFAPLMAEDLSCQPKTLVVTAEFDPLRDEGEAYARALAQAGGEVTLHRMLDALHGFFSLPPGFSHVRECYHQINRFLKEEKEPS